MMFNNIILKEMKNKTMIKHHCTSIRMAQIKKENMIIPSVDKDVEELELLYTDDVTVKWYNHFGTQVSLW